MDEKQIESLIDAIRRIGSGGTAGPEGLEAVGMALGGDGFLQKDQSVRSGLEAIASAIENKEAGGYAIAEALGESLVVELSSPSAFDSIADALSGNVEVNKEISNSIDRNAEALNGIAKAIYKLAQAVEGR